jgi:hypothetical protein
MTDVENYRGLRDRFLLVVGGVYQFSPDLRVAAWTEAPRGQMIDLLGAAEGAETRYFETGKEY